jgi:class 3 adenylate cyclase
LAAERFQSVKTDFGLLWMMGMIGEVCRQLDEPSTSEMVYELASPFARRFAIPGYVAGTTGCGHHHLGILATTTKRYEDARYHLDAALEIHQTAGFEYLATRTRLAQAQLYHSRGERGDAEKSGDLLRRVVDVSSRFGFKQTLQDALELRVRLQGIDTLDTTKSIHAIAAEVGRDQPALVTQAAPDGTVTILFTDIEGSTALNEDLGDQAWLNLLAMHDRIIRAEVAKAGGVVVKSRGDGFMLAFPSAWQALAAAIETQRALSRHNSESPGSTPIRVRIGVHSGDVVKQSGDFLGRHVNYASRIADAAVGGEILVSGLTKGLVQGRAEFHFGSSRNVALKGIPGDHEAFSLSWSPDRSRA